MVSSAELPGTAKETYHARPNYDGIESVCARI
jgi:hypothetical protein